MGKIMRIEPTMYLIKSSFNSAKNTSVSRLLSKCLLIAFLWLGLGSFAQASLTEENYSTFQVLFDNDFVSDLADDIIAGVIEPQLVGRWWLTLENRGYTRAEFTDKFVLLLEKLVEKTQLKTHHVADIVAWFSSSERIFDDDFSVVKRDLSSVEQLYSMFDTGFMFVSSLKAEDIADWLVEFASLSTPPKFNEKELESLAELFDVMISGDERRTINILYNLTDKQPKLVEYIIEFAHKKNKEIEPFYELIIFFYPVETYPKAQKLQDIFSKYLTLPAPPGSNFDFDDSLLEEEPEKILKIFISAKNQDVKAGEKFGQWLVEKRTATGLNAETTKEKLVDVLETAEETHNSAIIEGFYTDMMKALMESNTPDMENDNPGFWAEFVSDLIVEAHLPEQVSYYIHFSDIEKAYTHVSNLDEDKLLYIIIAILKRQDAEARSGAILFYFSRIKDGQVYNRIWQRLPESYKKKLSDIKNKWHVKACSPE